MTTYYGRGPQSITTQRTRTPEQEAAYQAMKKAALEQMARDAAAQKIRDEETREYRKSHGLGY